jgi:uncharacterized protein
VNDPAQQLCLACGLCCNGVIFADGQLQPGDDAARLRALGLKLKARSTSPVKFHQPCGAFAGCRCTIYSERPEYCRAFDCSLLKRATASDITPDAALKVVRSAKNRAEKVWRLLQSLGCHDEHVALSVRFRRLSKRIHEEPLDAPRADLFAELTLAMHQLNVVLSREFYPGV